MREKKVDGLEKDREEVHRKREDDEREITRMHQLIQQEVEDKGKRDREEKDRQAELERKRQEKMDMEDAARYIQRKWKWYNEVGKHLAKKKKKGKKGKKGKKWLYYSINSFANIIYYYCIYKIMVEEPLKVGDPWSILPVKNAKYARDLTEVHLSERELDRVEHFEDFPNLEVIWLNNNRVRISSS